MPEKVVVAEKEVTVHKTDGGFTESVTLLPGQEFPFNSLAEYQQKAVEAGEVPGLKVKSSKAASKATKEAAPEEATETEDE